MAIDLGDYEKGEPLDGDYKKALKQVQKRLSHVQVAHIVHGRRAIIAFEGWDAAGKGGIIQRLTAQFDNRHSEVWPISAPTEEERARHFLYRFWARLPGSGEIVIFDRTWYGRVLVERVEGFAGKAEWSRAYDEINAFEAQQLDNDTTLVKLFVHVTQKEQDRRLIERMEHPWKRWKTGADDYRNRARRSDYLAAMHEMFAATDTRWAPWTVIDGNDKQAARIAALNAIADQLEAKVSMTPPGVDPALLRLAENELDHEFDL